MWVDNATTELRTEIERSSDGVNWKADYDSARKYKSVNRLGAGRGNELCLSSQSSQYLSYIRIFEFRSSFNV